MLSTHLAHISGSRLLFGCIRVQEPFFFCNNVPRLLTSVARTLFRYCQCEQASDILTSVEEHTVGIISVSACSAGFLIQSVDTFG